MKNFIKKNRQYLYYISFIVISALSWTIGTIIVQRETYNYKALEQKVIELTSNSQSEIVKVVLPAPLEKIRDSPIGGYIGIDPNMLKEVVSETAFCEYIDDLCAACKESDISEIFILALAGFESGWGSDTRWGNFFGWQGDSYKNLRDSLYGIIPKIKEMYLSPGGRYFNGYTLRDINICYNGRDEWLDGMVLTINYIYKNLDEQYKI